MASLYNYFFPSSFSSFSEFTPLTMILMQTFKKTSTVFKLYTSSNSKKLFSFVGISCFFTFNFITTFTFVAVSEESYNFVQLACKQLLLCQEDPVPLVKLLLKESSDNEEKYSGLLSFAKRLLSGLKLNDPVLEKVKKISLGVSIRDLYC